MHVIKAIFLALLLVFVVTFSSSCTNINKHASETSISSESSLPPGAFDSAKDFKYLNMTVKEADKLFGEPKIWEDSTHITRMYDQGVICKFSQYQLVDKELLIRLDSMVISLSGMAVLRGIQVGDSLESVLSKFPDEKKASYQDVYGEGIKPLYGKRGETKQYACITYQNDYQATLEISDGQWLVSMDIRRASQTVGGIQIRKQYEVVSVSGVFDSNEFDYLNTVDALDRLLGTPVSVEQFSPYEDVSGNDPNLTTKRKYDGAVVTYTKHQKNSQTEIHLFDITITKSGPALLRNIQVGDSFESVLAKFPDEKKDPYYDNNIIVKPLYGKVEYNLSYGCIQYQNDEPIMLRFSDSNMWLNIKISKSRVVEIDAGPSA